MKVGILDDYLNVTSDIVDWGRLPSSIERQHFTRPIPRQDLADTLSPFDILIVMRERTAFDRELLQRLPSLKLIVTTGPRNASIDLQACQDCGITVTGTRSQPTITAEVAWLHILAMIKKLDSNRLTGITAGWQTALPEGLKGRTLGLVGLGKIGQRMATIANAFEMNVIAWSQNLQAETAHGVGAQAVSKTELFSNADIISLHLVLSERTRHIVGTQELAQMKPTSYLINTSRAGLVDETALITALNAGTIAGAGLDVFETEPLAADAPIRHAPSTLLTPHLGYVTDDNFRIYYADALENILAWLDGETLRPIFRT